MNKDTHVMKPTTSCVRLRHGKEEIPSIMFTKENYENVRNRHGHDVLWEKAHDKT
jgi:hypothetical protein